MLSLILVILVILWLLGLKFALILLAVAVIVPVANLMLADSRRSVITRR